MNNPKNAERMAYKLDEASGLLGVSASTMRRLIARGQIKSLRALRHILISKAELEKFVSQKN